VNRGHDAYSLPVRETALYIDAAGGWLSPNPVETPSSVSYVAADGQLKFEYEFSDDVEIVGPITLRLLEATQTWDCEVFAYIRKVGSDGQILVPLLPGGVPWTGAHGRLRATHRDLTRQCRPRWSRCTLLEFPCRCSREFPMRWMSRSGRSERYGIWV
jgi:hypothetical protein